MLRLIFIAVLVLLAFVAGIAVALHHYYGWKGLLAFPIILIALVWIGKKGLGWMFQGFALSLFSMKSRVLRGADMTVHSVTPVAKPEFHDDGETDSEDNETEGEDTGTEPEAKGEPEEPKEYFAVDMTITPRTTGGNSFWEPGEFILATERISSLMDFEDETKQVGGTEKVEVWDGSAFGPDDPGKYPGVQRLRVTFAIKPGTSKAWLHYYAEAIGPLELPRWELRA